MISKKMLAASVLCLVALLAVLSSGCKKEEPAAAGGAGSAVAATFVNTKCPIMGNPISADSVTEDLTRQYKGQKVAFCCAGCPAKWDALSEEEKETKLAAAK